jgi:hypothetical protein
VSQLDAITTRSGVRRRKIELDQEAPVAAFETLRLVEGRLDSAVSGLLPPLRR